MEAAKKDGKRRFFAYIVVITKFTKNPDSYPLIHLKEIPRCFYSLGEKSNAGLECGFTSSVSYKKDNSLLELTLNFRISFVLHIDEAVHILNKPLGSSHF